MTSLGPLAGEPPEPMQAEDFERIQRRVRASFKGDILLDREDALRMLAEMRWLKRRLRRVENALEPLVDAVKDQVIHRDAG